MKSTLTSSRTYFHLNCLGDIVLMLRVRVVKYIDVDESACLYTSNTDTFLFLETCMIYS